MLKKQERLKGVNQRLVDVVLRACEALPFDVQLVEGVRTQTRQIELWNQGRDGKGGKIVTWTKNSKHIGGEAVDIVPLQADGTINWNDKQTFAQLANAMVEASRALNTKVKNGGDWNMNGVYGEKGETDLPHWELV